MDSNPGLPCITGRRFNPLSLGRRLHWSLGKCNKDTQMITLDNQVAEMIFTATMAKIFRTKISNDHNCAGKDVEHLELLYAADTKRKEGRGGILIRAWLSPAILKRKYHTVWKITQNMPRQRNQFYWRRQQRNSASHVRWSQISRIQDNVHIYEQSEHRYLTETATWKRQAWLVHSNHFLADLVFMEARLFTVNSQWKPAQHSGKLRLRANTPVLTQL